MSIFATLEIPTFTMGYVRAVTQTGDLVLVTVDGGNGKRYEVTFNGVKSTESSGSSKMKTPAT